ncbi:ArsR family transcriptional regulator [Natronolimnobius sp. AArcel1]|nr:ArsR family transcriptional regulator [Natronolimnobius sp. AArcel1]
MVVETLDEPTTINTIAEQAEVAWETANSEVKRLKTENKVRERDDGRYEPNPVQQFLDQILQLIEDHSKSELESQLQEYQEQVEDLSAEYGAPSAKELREQLTNDDVSAEEIREIRNVSETWAALELEIRHLKNALQLYDDLFQLSQSN